MRRVVVTGMGVICPIGNSLDEVGDALREGRSGIEFCQDYKDHGFRSHVHGMPGTPVYLNIILLTFIQDDG